MRKNQEQKMFKLISGWQKSGVSKKAWCTKHGIEYRIFHYWYHKYFRQQPSSVSSDGNGFVQLTVADVLTPRPWCELVVDQHKRLLFFQQPDVEFIRTLIQ